MVIVAVIIGFRISTRCHESPHTPEVGEAPREWGELSSRRPYLNGVPVSEQAFTSLPIQGSAF